MEQRTLNERYPILAHQSSISHLVALSDQYNVDEIHQSIAEASLVSTCIYQGQGWDVMNNQSEILDIRESRLSP
jgi:hypothetical protein